MEEKPINIVVTKSLVKSSTATNFESQPHAHFRDVRDYLGVTDLSVFALYTLWTSALGQAHGPESFEPNTIGRSVEQILGAASVPIKQQVRRYITKSIIYRLYSMGLQTLHK